MDPYSSDVGSPVDGSSVEHSYIGYGKYTLIILYILVNKKVNFVSWIEFWKTWKSYEPRCPTIKLVFNFDSFKGDYSHLCLCKTNLWIK